MKIYYLRAGKLLLATGVFGLLLGAEWVHSDADRKACMAPISVVSGSIFEISTTSTVLKQISPYFFGFNIEWTGFQSDLWSPEKTAVNADVIAYLRHFPGAVYRYPGGTVANHFDWSASVGPIAERRAQRAVSWEGPLVASFGFHEYLEFVTAVRGQAWLVTNLYGEYEQETAVDDLAARARSWAVEVRRSATPVLRWELGNELDRDRYQWPPEKYVERARSIATSIIEVLPDASFVAMLQDYDALKWIESEQYNAKVGASLKDKVSEFALHLYYDGAPGGPPVPHRLRHLCSSELALRHAMDSQPSIWITEHARWPAGDVTDHAWKANWPSTSNLEGAISVADMVIALSQKPSLQGAFLHSLSSSTSPWPLFHRTSDGFRPSAVYWALRIFRDDLLELVLTTQTTSKNDSAYKGGYSLRASVMTNKTKDRYVIWATNRSANAARVKLKIPPLAGGRRETVVTVLTDETLEANNQIFGNRIVPKINSLDIVFDSNGVAWLNIPGYAVVSVSIKNK